MKRLSIILGGAAAIWLIAYVVRFREPQSELATLNQESRRYADDAVIATATNWDERALLDRGSPELVEAAENAVDLDTLFHKWSRLGRMTHYGGARGEAIVTNNSETGPNISALYVSSAKFEHGYAQIRIGLIKRADGWRVASFIVYPVASAAPPRSLDQLHFEGGPLPTRSAQM